MPLKWWRRGEVESRIRIRRQLRRHFTRALTADVIEKDAENKKNNNEDNKAEGWETKLIFNGNIVATRGMARESGKNKKKKMKKKMSSIIKFLLLHLFIHNLICENDLSSIHIGSAAPSYSKAFYLTFRPVRGEAKAADDGTYWNIINTFKFNHIIFPYSFAPFSFH